jgi:alpha-amylase
VESGLDGLAAPFLAGGAWPAFLAKYPEANLMHKKMLWVSDALASRLAEASLDAVGQERARDLLYRAQSNCVYWHGVFGGLYLGHLRHAVFRDLLEAESLVAPVAEATVERLDFDRDGFEEAWIRTPEVNLLVAPEQGGGVALLELRAARMNLTNVLTRRPEAYHEEIRAAARAAAGAPAARASEAPSRSQVGAAAGEAREKAATIHAALAVSPELARSLVYDPHPRLSALEHFLSPEADLAGFRGTAEADTGAPLARHRLRRAETGSAGVRLLLEREGTPAVEKELLLEPGREALSASWRVRGAAPEA